MSAIIVGAFGAAERLACISQRVSYWLIGWHCSPTDTVTEAGAGLQPAKAAAARTAAARIDLRIGGAQFVSYSSDGFG